MAAVLARDTMMLTADVRVSEPRARSLTPSLNPCTIFDDESSQRVIGLEGFRRPVSMKDWIVERFRGVKSSAKLRMSCQRVARVLHHLTGHVLNRAVGR